MFSFQVSGENPNGLVTEAHTFRDTAETGLVKLVVDPARTVRCASPHWFEFEYGLPADENGWPIADAQTKATSFELLRINHYASRTEEECREKAARRGGWGHLRRWRQRDLEGRLELVPDDAIAHLIPRLRRSLERAGAAR
jgi:hypothetical protein